MDRNKYRHKVKAWLYFYDINEDEDLLEDEEKYLILHKDYKYPLVARYRSKNFCNESKPHFIYDNLFGEVVTNLSENKITHFALLLSRDEYLECINLCNR